MRLLDGVPVVILEGRMHLYEATASQITLPVRVLQRLGAELLLVTNACGGSTLTIAPVTLW